MTHDTTLFLGGSWVSPASDRSIEVTSASTEAPLGRVSEAVEADVDRAVEAARRVVDDPDVWSGRPVEERAAALERLAAEVSARAEETVRLVSAQNGMPVTTAGISEAIYPAILLGYYAEAIRRAPSEEVRPGLVPGTSTVVRREPVGVVAAVSPFNFPQTLTFFKLAPALAAGCAVVIKPSPETVLDAQLLGEAVEAADLPPGVVSIVPGGRETASYLVEHPGVDHVAFTGSVATGRIVGAACGRLIRPCTLELGGKSAAIVLDDAQLERHLEQFFASTLTHSGQTCFLGTRILAPRSRYGEIVDLVAGMASSATIGDPFDPATQLGPLVSRRQRDKVEGYIAKGLSDGARLVTGGGRPAGLDRGWYVEPTVFADVDNGTAIAQEEIFGPVLAVIPYDGDEEAVALANASDYGLGGTVWSADPERAARVAARVRTGSIGINCYTLDVGAPFGGVKASGIGRELGPEGLAAYQTLKSVYRAG